MVRKRVIRTFSLPRWCKFRTKRILFLSFHKSSSERERAEWLIYKNQLNCHVINLTLTWGEGGKALNHTSSVDEFERLSSKMSATRKSTRRGQRTTSPHQMPQHRRCVLARRRSARGRSPAAHLEPYFSFTLLIPNQVNIFPIEELFLFFKMQSGSKRELLYQGKRKRSSFKKYNGREGKLSLNITII